MSRFDHNFSMTCPDVIEYVREKLPGFFGDAELHCEEIGDGNINYVFRVRSEDGKSLIVKHAESTVRSSGNQTSTDRNRIEAEILQIERNLSETHVPKIYLYDPVMCCVVMQDIGDHENLRYALLEHKTFPTLAEDMAAFMAQTLLCTSDLVLSSAQKKAYVGQFINPSMCEITERLVLTDPYKNPGNRNRIWPGNENFVQQMLYDDTKLHLEIAKLKLMFQSKAQSLIHGDLHSGSVFVKKGSTMVLDPEFAFYGPAGYDVGNLIGRTLALFAQQARQIIQDQGRDPVFSTPGFAQWYVDDILRDTAGYAGTEIIRRVVGSAKFNFVESITEPHQRLCMERICIRAAKAFILLRDTKLREGCDYIQIMKNAVEVTIGND